MKSKREAVKPPARTEPRQGSPYLTIPHLSLPSRAVSHPEKPVVGGEPKLAAHPCPTEPRLTQPSPTEPSLAAPDPDM